MDSGAESGSSEGAAEASAGGAGAVADAPAGTCRFCESCAACAEIAKNPITKVQVAMSHRIFISRLAIGVAPRRGTSHGAINRVLHAVVIWRPTRKRMASIRAIKSLKVGSDPRSLMARGASRAIVRNLPPRVRKRRARPCRSRVAGGARARRRETRAGMIRHRPAQRRCALPVRRVAAVAIGWRHSRTGMAKVASDCDMRSGQREARGAVIECRAQP